jgi:hypothetical protein
MKVYKLCYGITVTVDDNGLGGISSELVSQFSLDGDTEEQQEVASAIADSLESLILAHACAGIDVSSAPYVEGIQTAVEAIVNNMF